MTFLSDLKKPTTFIGYIIGISGIVLSIVFYIASKKEKAPTYKIFPSARGAYIVYYHQNSSPTIRVLDKDSTLVEEDVNLIVVTFWNSGELPIEPEDVRVPVHLTLSPCNKILDYTIIKSTYPDVSNFTLTEEENPDTNSKSLIINWSHFDPGFGLEFQVIYSGSETASVSFDGMITGVSNFKDGSSLVHLSGDSPPFRRLMDVLYRST